MLFMLALQHEGGQTPPKGRLPGKHGHFNLRTGLQVINWSKANFARLLNATEGEHRNAKASFQNGLRSSLCKTRACHDIQRLCMRNASIRDSALKLCQGGRGGGWGRGMTTDWRGLHTVGA